MRSLPGAAAAVAAVLCVGTAATAVASGQARIDRGPLRVHAGDDGELPRHRSSAARTRHRLAQPDDQPRWQLLRRAAVHPRLAGERRRGGAPAVSLAAELRALRCRLGVRANRLEPGAARRRPRDLEQPQRPNAAGRADPLIHPAPRFLAKREPAGTGGVTACVERASSAGAPPAPGERSSRFRHSSAPTRYGFSVSIWRMELDRLGDRKPTVRQIYALAAALCERQGEELPGTALGASELIERLRRECGHPVPSLGDAPRRRRPDRRRWRTVRREGRFVGLRLEEP